MKAYLISGPEYTFITFEQSHAEDILAGLYNLEYADDSEYTFTTVEVNITIKKKE